MTPVSLSQISEMQMETNSSRSEIVRTAVNMLYMRTRDEAQRLPSTS